MNKLRIIMSGGQTGVDQTALNVARALGILCAGWCPPGRVCEDGEIPMVFPLTETPKERSSDAPDVTCSLRTEWNVRDSDATLIVKPNSLMVDSGTEWTEKCFIKYKRKFLIVDPFDTNAVNQIKKWLRETDIRILNIAGPSEKTYPGINKRSFEILMQSLTLQTVKE
jgi:hypothetical protein